MKFFFIGIKGSGMSSLALILKRLGHEVSGSDIEDFVFTQVKLEEQGIKIYGFGKEKFKDHDYDEIIIGNAFKDNHDEVINVGELTAVKVKYPQKVNQLVLENESIAIAGTNGKTTTTGMLVKSLEDQKPSFLIGDGVGSGNKNSDLFIFEACEYRETFLAYSPKYLLINNIEMDHPDFFRDLEHVREVFNKFAAQSEVLIINGDDDNCTLIEHKNKVTFGTFEKNQVRAQNIKYLNQGIKFNLIYNNEQLGEISLPFYGEHMLYNSLAVIALNLEMGRSLELTINNLALFSGVQRRFAQTVISKEKNIFLIDDYAHHPTAIELTLKAVRQKFANCKVVTIFQAHTFSRAETFAKEFAQTLDASDQIILAPIFASAREKQGDITIDVLRQEINPEKLINFEDCNFIEDNVVYCLLGAGNVDVLYKDKIINKYK